MIREIPKHIDKATYDFLNDLRSEVVNLIGGGDELKKAETRQSLKDLGLVIKRDGYWRRTDDSGDPI